MKFEAIWYILMLSLGGVIVVVKVKWVTDHQMLPIWAADEKPWSDHILRDKKLTIFSLVECQTFIQ